VNARIALLLACSANVWAQSIPPIPAAQLRSGNHFQSQTLRAQQADDAQNPGMLWVEIGKQQFTADCARCHANPSTLAPAFPRPQGTGAVNLDDAINACVETKLQRPRLAAESQPLLGLSAYLMHAARGNARKIAEIAPQVSSQHTCEGPRRGSQPCEEDIPAQRTVSKTTKTAPQVSQSPAWNEGKRIWFARQGKQDLSCALCHDGLWGKTLRNQTISQGHTVGYPTYRLEWQTLGSAERRIRACYFGMEAEVPPIGSPTLRALELYGAWRGGALPIEAPAVRR
jgi:L-cysteine S-thiosulfotransferase